MYLLQTFFFWTSNFDNSPFLSQLLRFIYFSPQAGQEILGKLTYGLTKFKPVDPYNMDEKLLKSKNTFNAQFFSNFQFTYFYVKKGRFFKKIW